MKRLARETATDGTCNAGYKDEELRSIVGGVCHDTEFCLVWRRAWRWMQ